VLGAQVTPSHNGVLFLDEVGEFELLVLGEPAPTRL
jgi:predicted ATPase with chaperone activity